MLTASGTIYLVNINPRSRSIKAVVHSGQDGAVLDRRIPIEPFVYKNGVPDAGEPGSVKRRRSRTGRAIAT